MQLIRTAVAFLVAIVLFAQTAQSPHQPTAEQRAKYWRAIAEVQAAVQQVAGKQAQLQSLKLTMCPDPGAAITDGPDGEPACIFQAKAEGK